MDGPSSDHISLDPEPPSLVDEGLRIARQYGLGPEFESELEVLKAATTAAAVTQDTLGVVEPAEGSEESASMWNNGTGVSDMDQDNITT